MPKTSSYQPRLKVKYNQEIIKELQEELGLKNRFEVPKLVKIVINSGLGKAKDDKKIIEVATNTISKISGQMPIATTAKGAIAAFKLREGNKIGLKTTLRGDQMYEMLDRLTNLVIPRIRDFHGMSNKAFDRQGNYALGFSDQSVFPELSFEETATPHGLQVIIVIKSKSIEHSKKLLEKFGLPFNKEEK